ncbi:DUF2752 domain-containing protein [Ancylomarina sp. DW003]|nr:DUF2752 domain-containing protein [Ancylomarina sp. DW003]MDE5421468.1 DUF2752 domain-containing protein [Ancylomarina sp. DW003]
MWQNLIHWLEKRQVTCQFYNQFQIECPGCGFQSAFIALLKGDLLESLKLYPALLPILFFSLSLVIHIKFRSKWTILSNRFFAILSGLLILSNYINKII